MSVLTINLQVYYALTTYCFCCLSTGNKQDIKLTVQSSTDELQFEDILILHLEHGKDHFITVTGEQ